RPVISSISPQSIDEDTGLTVPVVIGDFETAAGALLVTAHSSDQLLLPDGAMNISGVGSNRFLTLLPATNQFGNANVTVTVTDGDGISASNSFGITIRPVNDAPGISAMANQVTDEDIPIGPITFSISDVDGVAGLSV